MRTKHDHDRTEFRSTIERQAGRGEGPGGRRRHHPDETGGHARMHGRSRRGRGRAQRGDIRAACLLLLADNPMHGYQLMQAIADRTHGAWHPSPGAIYPTIAQLEDEGLVTVTPDSGRKLVALTQAGRDHLAAYAGTRADPFTSITEQAGGTNDLRGTIEQLRVAARAVATSGSSAQIIAAQDILSQARRALYLILAEDTHPQTQPDQE